MNKQAKPKRIVRIKKRRRQVPSPDIAVPPAASPPAGRETGEAPAGKAEVAPSPGPDIQSAPEEQPEAASGSATKGRVRVISLPGADSTPKAKPEAASGSDTKGRARVLSLPGADSTPGEKPDSTSLFRQFLRGMYDAVLMVDDNGLVVECNRRAGRLFRCPPDSLKGMSVGSLLSGMKAGLLAEIRKNLETGRFTLLEGTCLGPDDYRFPAEIAVSRMSGEGWDNLVLSIRNIARRRSMEERLRTEHNAVHNSGSGIVITGIDGAIKYANPAFLSICGVDEESLKGRTVESALALSGAGENLVERPLRGEDWSGEVDARLADSRQLRLQVTAAANRDDAGRPIGLVYSFVDVSKRHQAELKIQREAEAQMQAVRQGEDFSGRLHVISLADVVQLIQSTGKNGTLIVLDDAGEPLGMMGFADGELQAATRGNLSGEAAFKELMTGSGSAFRFDPEGKLPRDPSIQKNLMTMLMEVAQSLDEA